MSKGKVLIIDDEKDLLETMKFRLEAGGYDVVTAEDGQTGIEMAIKEHPDLIILDVMMPGMDGFDTLKKLKDEMETKGIPAIIFSCGAEEEVWAKRSLHMGAAGYVVKPFESDSLLFTVEKFVNRK